MTASDNKNTVINMWNALYKKDWETLKSCMHPEIHYRDACVDDGGAHGPEGCVRRLNIGFKSLSNQEMVIHHIAAEGEVVFLDHTETWIFRTGEVAINHFATMHEMKDGKVYRWTDYWDFSKFTSNWPDYFLEELAEIQADFG